MRFGQLVGQMTEEEADRVLRAETLYEVLKVEKTCTDEEIKKSYRRIAVKVHPDRCKHPKATEAFQRISHAYQTLSDPDKRAHYDRFGDRPAPQPGPEFHNMHGFTRYGNVYQFGDELSPEDIFEMFFGMHPGMQGPFRFHHARRPPPQPTGIGEWVRMLLPILSLVFLLFMSMRSQEPALSDVIIFSDHIDSRYYQVLTSSKLHQKFGVPKNWLRDQFARGRARNKDAFYNSIRTQADDLYLMHVANKCRHERGRDGPACREFMELQEVMAR